MDKLRLKGFEDKWEKALYKGKELLPQFTLAESGIPDGAEITTVKIWLHAEGKSHDSVVDMLRLALGLLAGAIHSGREAVKAGNIYHRCYHMVSWSN
eukprot:scaffold624365_cov45-Prasinocladus_malaysianus.AAC.1